jgi:hypothetical protein
MSRALLLGTILFASLILSTSWAQNKAESTQTGIHFPFTKTISQWEYSCQGGDACTFVCPGGGVTQVTKLRLYLGAVSIDGGQNIPAVFYEFNSRQFLQGSGFGMSSVFSTLSCQMSGMTLDYYGPPK